MFDFKDDRYTHMPFAASDANDDPKEFCCIMTGGVWKLHHFTGKRWKRIRTGLPEDAIECAPCAEFEDGMWKISFIAGGAVKDRRFRLYRIYGIGGEAIPQVEADVGFVRKDRVAYAGRRGPIRIVEPGRMVTLELPEAEFLYRVSYDPFQANRLLISGQFRSGEIFSWAYHPGIRKLYEIIADGVPAYKAALYGDDCFYARRNGEFEERHIAKAAMWELIEIPSAIVEIEERTYARSTDPEFE